MGDIKRQWSRVTGRIYRSYLDGSISESQYLSRQGKANKAYDRYERNIARQQGKTPMRGISNYPGQIDHDIQYSRKAYAGNNG